jgi:hypothetical protein
MTDTAVLVKSLRARTHLLATGGEAQKAPVFGGRRHGPPYQLTVHEQRALPMAARRAYMTWMAEVQDYGRTVLAQRAKQPGHRVPGTTGTT